MRNPVSWCTSGHSGRGALPALAHSLAVPARCHAVLVLLGGALCGNIGRVVHAQPPRPCGAAHIDAARRERLEATVRGSASYILFLA